jgi:hypothetical protein
MNCRAAAWTRDVRLDDRAPEERRVRAFDRHFHAGECRDRLRSPGFGDLEVVLRQVRHEFPLRVGDDGVDFDVVDFHLESHRRLSGVLRRRRGRLPDQYAPREEQQGNGVERLSHGGL